MVTLDPGQEKDIRCYTLPCQYDISDIRIIYRISSVDEEVNDKCWKYSPSQLSQITPSGGSQDN